MQDWLNPINIECLAASTHFFAIYLLNSVTWLCDVYVEVFVLQKAEHKVKQLPLKKV